MSKKQKLELTWIGKENWPKLEPRILLEDLDSDSDSDKSYHTSHRVSDNDERQVWLSLDKITKNRRLHPLMQQK